VDEIDSVLWSACIRHVIDVENSYLRNTEVPQLIINLNDEDEDDEQFFEEIEKELEKKLINVCACILHVIAINIPSDVMTIITTADVGLKSELVERGF
jgi:hypothetical protein